MTNAEAAIAPKKKAGGAFNRETVLEVQHYTDRLFRFRTTRDPAFRFINGQFAMMGLEVDGRPLLRAYSMASANYEDDLEFFSIKVPDGPLTSRLASTQGRRPACWSGASRRARWCSPACCRASASTCSRPARASRRFPSIIRDPEVYDLYDNLILVHGCRHVAELKYGLDIVEAARNNEFFGEIVREKLHPLSHGDARALQISGPHAPI